MEKEAGKERFSIGMPLAESFLTDSRNVLQYICNKEKPMKFGKWEAQ
jgi:hypothetical protein